MLEMRVMIKILLDSAISVEQIIYVASNLDQTLELNVMRNIYTAYTHIYIVIYMHSFDTKDVRYF